MVTGMITSMLLELDTGELFPLLKDDAALATKVGELTRVLEQEEGTSEWRHPLPNIFLFSSSCMQIIFVKNIYLFVQNSYSALRNFTR